MLKSTQTIVAGLRGGNRPCQAALAVVLGLLGGLILGWNLSVCLVLAAAIFLNLPTRLLAAASLAGVALAWLAADWVRSFGVVLLDRADLGRSVAALGDHPIVAMLGWDCYALVGGAALALAVGVPIGFLAASIATWRNSRTPKAASLWFRPCGAPLAAAVIAAALAAPWWIGPKMAGDELLRQFTDYNTAEVSAAGVQLSLWTGKFVVRDLRIADPEHLDRDRLRIGRLIGKLSPGQLVRGRLHVETVSLEHVRADTNRSQLARADDDSSPTLEIATNDAATSHDERQIEIDSYLHDWPVVRHDLAWLDWLAAAVERLADAESDEGQPALATTFSARSNLGVRQPQVLILRLSASDLAARWRLGRKALIELTELSSDPRAMREPTRLRVVAPQLAGELTVQFELQGGRRRHAMKCSACDLNFAQIIGAEPATRDAVATKGTANLTGEGWMDRLRLQLPLQIEMEPHDVPLDGPGNFAGLDHDMWRKSLSYLDRLRLEATLGGPWTAPRLMVDAERLVEQLKQQLRAAGEYALVQTIDEQLAHPDPEVGAVMQASASESDPASPGVSRLSDDDAAMRTGPPKAIPDTAAAGRSEATPPATSYPSTSTPDEQPAAGFAQQPSEAMQSQSPPIYPITDVPPAPPVHRERPRTLPGPVNLFVGLDPIATQSASSGQPAPSGVDLPPPASPPTFSNNVYEDDLSTAPEETDQPGTIVRRSFLARWSEALRSRFNRASRVPEPEPIDDLTPPFAPPAYENAPPTGPTSEPGMPAVAGQPWYRRMWR